MPGAAGCGAAIHTTAQCAVWWPCGPLHCFHGTLAADGMLPSLITPQNGQPNAFQGCLAWRSISIADGVFARRLTLDRLFGKHHLAWSRWSKPSASPKPGANTARHLSILHRKCPSVNIWRRGMPKHLQIRHTDIHRYTFRRKIRIVTTFLIGRPTPSHDPDAEISRRSGEARSQEPE